jgi:alanine dehydrogenase
LTLLVSNEDVAACVTMEDCIEAVRRTYMASLSGRSDSRSRSTFWTPLGRGMRHNLASLEGVGMDEGVAVIRFRSDVNTTSGTEGRLRDDKYAGRPGLFCGLVLIFDLVTGEPLAILNDGLLQQMRVAATSAVAAAHMARPDSRVLGLVGSGHQARAHAQAFVSSHSIEQINVFSPNRQRRDQFADELSDDLDVQVAPVDDVAGILSSADIVAACTNARAPVFDTGGLLQGTHVTSVRHWAEIDSSIFDRARVILHQNGEEQDILLGTADERKASHIPSSTRTPHPSGLPTLVDLISGSAVGRANPEEVTYFLNNRGTGLQFVAVGNLAYRKAREIGLGRDLPTEWFLQATSS